MKQKNGAQNKKKELYFNNAFVFQLNESSQTNLTKTRTSDFYKLFNTKTYTAGQPLFNKGRGVKKTFRLPQHPL